MHRIFRKKDILTVPNLLSVVRLLLIPVIIWLYCGVENQYAAIGAILLSGATDIVDGFIARRFNMMSDFGKILDPVANKLTQAAMLICLMFRYRLMWALILFPRMTLWLANGMICVCCAMILVSLALYARFYHNFLRAKREENQEADILFPKGHPNKK